MKFFQTFWNTYMTVLSDILEHIHDVGSCDLARLNYGIITLIPKVLGASETRQLRPITVINMSKV